MIHRIMFTLVFLSSSALADPCDTKEYAQYKDQGASPFSRRLLANEYCALHQYEGVSMRYPSRANDARASRCAAEKSKILQVFLNNNDLKAHAYATGGCVDKYDAYDVDPGKSTPQKPAKPK